MMLVKLLVPMRLYIGLSGGIYPAGSIVQLSAELATSLIASGSAVLVTSGTPPTVPGGAGGGRHHRGRRHRHGHHDRHPEPSAAGGACQSSGAAGRGRRRSGEERRAGHLDRLPRAAQAPDPFGQRQVAAVHNQVARVQPGYPPASAGDTEEAAGELPNGFGKHQGSTLAGGKVDGHCDRVQRERDENKRLEIPAVCS